MIQPIHPVFENGKLKYIFINISEVTERVLERQHKEDITQKVKNEEQIKYQNAILNMANRIQEKDIIERKKMEESLRKKRITNSCNFSRKFP